MHEPQPPASLAALRAAVAGRDAFALTALHELVALSGSLVLGLAVADGALDPAEAWDLSRIDESLAGRALGRRRRGGGRRRGAQRADFLRARELIALLGDPPAAAMLIKERP